MADCKISADLQINASDMPVTINLCSDASGKTLSTALQFVTVVVSDNVTLTPVSGQPGSRTSNTFTLNLKPGKYRIDMAVGPAEGASPSAKSKAFVFEACNNPMTQLCFFDTAVSSTCAFRLGVIDDH